MTQIYLAAASQLQGPCRALAHREDTAENTLLLPASANRVRSRIGPCRQILWTERKKGVLVGDEN